MWPLSKIHQVGELIAAVGVIVSLIFVGYEVQQNNETHIQTSTQILTSDFARAVISVGESVEIACIYTRGIQNFEGLSGSEQIVFSTRSLALFMIYQDMQRIHEQGSMDPMVWAGFNSILREVVQLPGYRQWFAIRRHWFGPEFQRYWDDLAKEPAAIEPVNFDDPACAVTGGA